MESNLNTINGLERVLVKKTEELIKEFAIKQPPLGDSALQGYYAEKLIYLIRGAEKDKGEVGTSIERLGRNLLANVEALLKEFATKQPGWGDAAVEFSYAEKIIHIILEH
jgi:hypothetical protein